VPRLGSAPDVCANTVWFQKLTFHHTSRTIDRATRLIRKRLTGDKQERLLKEVKDLAEKAQVNLDP
jgi:hypothetical protein